jgi:hypothetical protein
MRSCLEAPASQNLKMPIINIGQNQLNTNPLSPLMNFTSVFTPVIIDVSPPEATSYKYSTGVEDLAHFPKKHLIEYLRRYGKSKRMAMLEIYSGEYLQLKEFHLRWFLYIIV